MGLFSRGHKTPPPTTAPTGPPYAVAVGRGAGVTPGGWKPWNGQANANDQIGAYAAPPSSQVASYWNDIQLKCGVEGMRPWWFVYTPSDVPFFQQTIRPVNIAQQQKGGGRAGNQLGPAQVSALLGPQRQIAAKQLQAVANGFLGW